MVRQVETARLVASYHRCRHYHRRHYHRPCMGNCHPDREVHPDPGWVALSGRSELSAVSEDLRFLAVPEAAGDHLLLHRSASTTTSATSAPASTTGTTTASTTPTAAATSTTSTTTERPRGAAHRTDDKRGRGLIGAERKLTNTLIVWHEGIGH